MPPFPYIPEPNFIIQPASLTYQAMPMPVPCFCPPPCPPYPPCPPWPQPMPFAPQQPFSQPFPPYAPYPQGIDNSGNIQQAAQQVFSPATAMASDPPMVAFGQDPWQQYSAPWPPAPPPFTPPMEPMPLLLPEFSSAPRPDFSPFEAEDDTQIDLYDQFYRDWYGQ